MLKKKDLKLVGAFIPKVGVKRELGYACVGRGGIFATDTRKAIMLHDSELNFSDILVHKKLLKGFESTMSKDDDAKLVVDGFDTRVECEGSSMTLNTAVFEYIYPESVHILDKRYPNHFILSDLSDILLELSERKCFIDSFHLDPLIEHSGGDWYDVFYSPMAEKDMGAVKIIATKVIEKEEVVFYTAVIMGREFKSQAKE